MVKQKLVYSSLIALAFVVGSLMTGSLVDAAPVIIKEEKSTQGDDNGIPFQEKLNEFEAQLQKSLNEFEAQLQEQVDSSALLTSELEAQITTLETDINQLEEQLQEQVDSSALLSIEIEAQIESASNMPERYTKTGIYFVASNPTPADFNCDGNDIIIGGGYIPDTTLGQGRVTFDYSTQSMKVWVGSSTINTIYVDVVWICAVS